MYVLKQRRWRLFFLFVFPAFAIYTYFVINSIVQTGGYSLTKWDAISAPKYFGFGNYERFFSNKDFYMVMQNTLLCVVISIAIQIPLGLIGAYLIYRTKHGFRAYRFMVFVPVVMSAAAIGLLFSMVFNAEFGPINSLLGALGLTDWQRSWLSDQSVVYYAVMTPMTYQWIGFYVIIELSGMQSIPLSVIESAQIDGANSARTFFHIVLPYQKGITKMCIILLISGCFKAFDQSYIMTWGGPGYSSSFLGVYMYLETFLKGNFGRGSAVAVVILFGSLLFTLLVQVLVKEE